jgi:hypothetical protein
MTIDKTTPKCFDTLKQYKGWVAAARMSQPTPTHSYCEDCTPDFQAKMIREMRCQYPGTLFHKAEGGWVGRRSFVEVSKIKRRTEIGEPDLI